MSEPYGAEGCRCDREFSWDDREETWYDNAHCPHHGVLAKYTPPRMDTGTYQVISPAPERVIHVEPEPSFVNRVIGERGCNCFPNAYPSSICPSHGYRDVEVDSLPACGLRPAVVQSSAATKKETGVLATVRRAWRNWRRGSGCCDRV